MLVRKKPGDDGHLRLVRDVCLEGDRLTLKRASHLFGRGPVYVSAQATAAPASDIASA